MTKKADPTKRDVQVAQMLLKESDRGCAIFGAAALDDALEVLLRSRFRQDDSVVKNVVDPLFRTYAPLSTFSARIDVSHVLGLLAKRTYRELKVIRRLRNDFAHERGPLTFDDPRCSDRLASLIGAGSGDDVKDVEKVLAGDQFLTRSQLTTRIAFGLAITRSENRILFVAGMLTKGLDPQLAIDAWEREDAE